MADLDISELLEDPDFADECTVIRRRQVVDDNGRSSDVNTTFDSIVMNITPAGRNDVERLDDSQRQLRAIKAITRFRLQGPTIGMNADLVNWQGSMYLVAVVDPYTQFGGGFVEAVLVSTNMQESKFK
jgi:hypothetical protein